MKSFQYKKKLRKRKKFTKKNKKYYKKHLIKKVKCKYTFIFQILKLIFLLLIFCVLKKINNYSKKILNYYYSKRIKYLRMIGKTYDESNLVTFSDKINWLSIHDVSKLKGKCADKILLHEYSKRILKKDICNKILKIYDDPYQIDISELPEQFVLKTNHGSGYNIIVHNKNELNIEKAKRKLSDWLKIAYNNSHQEFHYSFIKKKVFVEEYLGKHIITYKFFCYNGVPRIMYTHQLIEGKEYLNFFDMEWNPLIFKCFSPPQPNAFNFKTKNFELMKKYAKKLSKPFIFVRVDLYEYNNEIRLGELTFLPMNGYYNCDKKFHLELGKYLKLFTFKSKFVKLFAF